MAGVTDFVRELLIKIGVVGGAEARAEMDAQAASVEKVREAGKGAAEAAEATVGASAAQANALKDVEGALERATSNAASFAAVSVEGGKNADVVYQALSGSVNSLEAAIVKAGGAKMVPPETITALDGFKAQLLAAQPPVEEHAKGMGRVRDAHIGAKVGMDVSREAMGPIARAFYALSESGNAVVASIGKLGLVIGGTLGGFVILGKAFSELNARGVDVTTMGDRMSGIWDSLAIAMGGTSKATAGMVADLQKTQASFEGIAPEARAYATGLELVAAAQTGANDPIKLFAAVAGEVPHAYDLIDIAVDAFIDRQKLAETAAGDFNKSLNVIRATSPDVAAAFTAEFFALSRLPEGSKAASDGLNDLRQRMETAKTNAETFTASLQRMHPGVKDVGVQFEKWTQEITSTDRALQAARASGLTETQIVGLLGPALNKVAVGYAEFGQELTKHNPTLAATARAQAEMAAASSALADKIAGVKVALAEETDAYAKLLVGIQAGISAEMSAGQADAAQAEKAKALLDALEKKKLRLDEAAAAEIAMLSPS